MTATLTDVTARAAADLLTIRETWGDLLAAIDGPRDRTWPPRDNIDAALRPDDAPAIGRLPLTLREHPAPVNLDALDAALDTERDLFELADRIAEYAQRRQGPADRLDPRRWHLPTVRGALLPRLDPRVVLTATDPRTDEDREAQAEHAARCGIPRGPRRPPARRAVLPVAEAGSRAHGLHWAAVWIEGRLTGDDPELFAPVPARLADEAAATIRRCAQRVERALDRDVRVLALDRPCPWCRGPLVARTAPGAPERSTVECRSGHDCTAPVPVESGRRVWRGTALVQLDAALNAAERRAG